MASQAPDPQQSMLEALDATRLAIHHYANACRTIQSMPHPSLASALLAMNVRRLEAMEEDLQRRVRPQATRDALYTSLNVVHAGLLSLADASGRLRHIYRQAMPVAPPVEGWFMEVPDQVLRGGLVHHAAPVGIETDET